METDNLSQSGWMLLFYFLDLEMYTHAVNHLMHMIQGKYLSMKVRRTLSNCLFVWLFTYLHVLVYYHIMYA